MAWQIAMQSSCSNSARIQITGQARLLVSPGNSLFVSGSLSAHGFTKGRWTQRECPRPKEVLCRCKVHLVGIGEVTGEINCLSINH